MYTFNMYVIVGPREVTLVFHPVSNIDNSIL